MRAFLDALHAVETDVLPPTDWVGLYREQCAEFERLVLPLLDVDERAASRAASPGSGLVSEGSGPWA